jgi:hypothetical protein
MPRDKTFAWPPATDSENLRKYAYNLLVLKAFWIISGNENS